MCSLRISIRRHVSLSASLPFPIQAARVVVTWLNKAKEAEERRARTAAEPLAFGAGGSEDNGESSEEDDEDQDEFVYDIQVYGGAVHRVPVCDFGVGKRHVCLPMRCRAVPKHSALALGFEDSYPYQHISVFHVLILTLSVAVALAYAVTSPVCCLFTLQSVEELAMGDEGWCYQPPDISSSEEVGSKGNAASGGHKGEEGGVGVPTGVADIRRIIAQLAKREDR